MGSRGPLKLVDFTKSNPAVATPKPAATLPKCPSWLTDPAKREWRRVAKPLFCMGLLTNLDVQTLAMYCQAWARYQECEAVLAAEGDTFIQPNGVPKQRPEYYIAKDSLVQLREFIKLFGLSPSARMRMDLPEPVEVDELEELLD